MSRKNKHKPRERRGATGRESNAPPPRTSSPQAARGARPSADRPSSVLDAAPTVGCGAPGPPAAIARLQVRPALRGDLTPLEFFFDALLRRDYFLRRGQLREMIGGAHHRVWVAEIDSVLVGAAVVSAGCRLVNALVHPAYRGLGIGRALVEATGAQEVRAKLDMSDGDPRGFYESLGFESTGERNAKGNIELLRAATPPFGGDRGTRKERKVRT